MKPLSSTITEHLFLSHLLDTISDGVYAMEPDGKISIWSKSMEKISGYTAEEAVGNTCSLLKPYSWIGTKGVRDPSKCATFKGTPTGSRECFIRHKDGHDIPVIKNATPISDEKGQLIGVIESVTSLSGIEKGRLLAKDLDTADQCRLDKIIGKSDCIQNVYTAIKATASSNATILIEGESGTGKELVASSVHYRSARSNGPFVIVNCSALSESLLESELFGHTKGAFTGASSDRTGRLEKADKGTIFLDEIGELSPLVQVKLLRVLQEKTIERLGESKPRHLDIRVITATNRDLYALVKEGKFREDLYYRLKVFPIHVPPLRDRKTDIPLLVHHFCNRLSAETGKDIQKVSPKAMQLLLDHPWPGNVRELENAIEHAFVLCTGRTILPDHLPLEIRETAFLQHEPKTVMPQIRVRSSLTKDLLITKLKESGWNKAQAARALGISRTSVWKRMKQWEIPLQKP
ncbi:MAG: sigma 54-interacting transcriptional regulator [Desulfobacterales bacterium]|nr:sigma 54-interacting transcriptional regulator [Desulfobacterales bacterium]